VTVTEHDTEPESHYDELLREIAHASERAPTPTDSELVPGSLVAGKFRIARTIGVGGMGKVYEVEHVVTKHRRALKILHPGASADVVERFIREASAAGRIGNPHVAETFDAGRIEGGAPYLLMELLDGETLEERLRRLGPIDPGELADLIHQACEGIQAAHEAGIIHRDLKPDNLFVEVREGEPFVKILDFGISKFDEGKTGALGITKEDSVMGTPYYMSPEQVRRTTSVDARTDIYALGVILYECACGQRPFDAKTVERLAVLIHKGHAVPLARRMPSLPRAFCEVVERAMATEPDQRFDSARALARALAPLRSRVVRPDARARASSDAPPAAPTVRASAGSTLRSDPPQRRSRRRRAFSVMVVAGVVAASATAWVVARSRGEAPTPAAPPIATTRAPASSPGNPATSEASATGAVVGMPPLVLPVASTAPAGAADPSRPASPTSTAHPGARPGTAPSGSATRKRMEQKGLADENPFR
jgi:serine/threonine-protein kinase